MVMITSPRDVMEIFSINAAAFHLLSKRKSEDEIFVATLHEIDALLQQRCQEQEKAAAITALTVELTNHRQSAAQFALSISELDAEPLIPPEYAGWVVTLNTAVLRGLFSILSHTKTASWKYGVRLRRCGKAWSLRCVL
ncbi:hypothetical protein IFR05_016267 [Cadophora sp. M221]|nr:hypothetical protein IFR05_016267 [Cadophora sp. M221]